MMRDCPHCGLPFAGDAHGCPESRPKPNLVDRLREDHRDTLECEHGFNLYDGATCSNVVCLARDLRAAADRIEAGQSAIRDLVDSLQTLGRFYPFPQSVYADNARHSVAMALAFLGDTPVKCRKCDGRGIYKHDLPGGAYEHRVCSRCSGGGSLTGATVFKDSDQ